MTFAAHETSVAGGNPVQLFLFVYGTETDEYFAYTDHTDEIVIDHGEGAITYSPVPIERGSIDSNGTLDKSALRIATDVGTGLAELFRVYPPPYVVSLIIRQGHIEDVDDEFLVVWAGRIVSCAREGGQAIMSGEPVSTSLRRPGLRRHYQYGCPHQLYGPVCLADKPSKTVAATVASVAGASVTLNAGWEGAFTPAKFLGGLFEWPTDSGSTDRRTILRITGNTLYLSGIPSGVEATDAVDVVLGCNHQAFAASGGDCEGLHDNILNYGGQPWIPLKNPIGPTNNYF